MKEVLPHIKTVLSSNNNGFHKVSYRHWQNKSNDNNLFCLHGVTRNSRDFDYLGRSLVDEYSVFCPDFAGRGESDGVASLGDLQISNYAIDVAMIMGKNECQSIDLLGTSMGGIVSMVMAGRRNSPIRKLILNDVGPYIPKEIFAAVAMHERIKPLGYSSLGEAVEFHKEYCSGFGPMSDEQWCDFTLCGMKRNVDGMYVYDYNDQVHQKVLNDSPKQDIDLWSVWDKISCPVLVLRGAESYALSKDVAEQMRQRGPKAEVIEFEGTGHAPHLMSDEHVDIIRNWLSLGVDS